MSATRSLFGLVQEELVRVERDLAEAAKTDHPFLGPILSLLLPGTGKRLRPALALLAGKIHEFSPEPTHHMALGVELLHTASLLHDDVVDGSETRRGEAALFTRVGNALSVLVGDYLFAQSAAQCVATADLRVIGLFAETLASMCQGQIEEASRERGAHLLLTEEEYFQTIYGKTASLFILACQGGAILSRAKEETVQAMREFGLNLGLAFQIVDDILDFAGDEKTLGKPVGNDLRQGIVTLPLIYFREESGNGFASSILGPNGELVADVDQLVQMVRQSSAIERCYSKARDLADKALDALRLVPPGEVRDSLAEIAVYMLERQS